MAVVILFTEKRRPTVPQIAVPGVGGIGAHAVNLVAAESKPGLAQPMIPLIVLLFSVRGQTRNPVTPSPVILVLAIPMLPLVALQGNVIGIYRGMERGHLALTNSITVYHYLYHLVGVMGAALMAVRVTIITVVVVPFPALFKRLSTCERDRHFTKENL